MFKRKKKTIEEVESREIEKKEKCDVRKVPVNCVPEGTVIGKSILSGETVLVRKGSRFSSKYIPKLMQLGIDCIYVEDELSREIADMDAISDKLRVEAKKAVSTIFTSSKVGKECVEQVSGLVNSIIEEMLSKRNQVINGVDIKTFDNYTFEHSVNVCVLSILMGVNKRYTQEQLYNLGVAALFHDIGKVFIPEEILNKQGKLTDDEFDLIKKHPQSGFEYIKNNFGFDFNGFVRMGIKDHHEKYDGTGYPSGKKGKDISEIARIIAVADVYDALTSKRPYKKAMLPSEAFEMVMGMAGTHLDIEIVSIFKECIAIYPIGTGVRLTNGVEGIVVDNFSGFGDRPLIRSIDFNEYNLLEDVSLRSVLISEIIDVSTLDTVSTEVI